MPVTYRGVGVAAAQGLAATWQSRGCQLHVIEGRATVDLDSLTKQAKKAADALKDPGQKPAGKRKSQPPA
jgi:hypothetical protein